MICCNKGLNLFVFEVEVFLVECGLNIFVLIFVFFKMFFSYLVVVYGLIDLWGLIKLISNLDLFFFRFLGGFFLRKFNI